MTEDERNELLSNLTWPDHSTIVERMKQAPRAFAFQARQAAQNLSDMDRSAVYDRIDTLDHDIRYLFWFAWGNFALIIGTMVVVLWTR